MTSPNTVLTNERESVSPGFSACTPLGNASALSHALPTPAHFSFLCPSPMPLTYVLKFVLKNHKSDLFVRKTKMVA